MRWRLVDVTVLFTFFFLSHNIKSHTGPRAERREKKKEILLEAVCQKIFVGLDVMFSSFVYSLQWLPIG